MDAARISAVLAEAEAQIVALDQALDSGNDEAAIWTLTILAGILQDLGRLGEEEPIPAGVDKQKFAANIQTALHAVAEGTRSIQAGEYRLPRSDSVILVLALDDIKQIVKATSGGPSANETVPGT